MLSRKKAKQGKIKRLEKKLLQIGYDNLEPYSIDRIHTDKWLGAQKIAELEAIRLKHIQEQECVPKQLNLTDYIEFLRKDYFVKSK